MAISDADKDRSRERRSRPCRIGLAPGDGNFSQRGPRLLWAAVAGFVEEIEEAGGVGSRESIESMGLAFLDGVVRIHAASLKVRSLHCHQVLPAHGVEFADEHIGVVSISEPLLILKKRVAKAG